MDSSPRSLPPSSRRPLFDTLVGSSNALRIFLEFCSAYDGSGRGDGGSRDGDAWTSLIMFWLDAEHYRQLVGDADAMERHGLKIWDDYLDSSDGEDGSGLAAADPRHVDVRSVLPRAELRRLRRVCSSYAHARAMAVVKKNGSRKDKKEVSAKRPRPCSPLPDCRRLGLDTFSRAQAFVQIHLTRHAMPVFFTSDAYSKSLIGMASSPDRGSVDSAAMMALDGISPSSDSPSSDGSPETQSKAEDKRVIDDSKGTGRTKSNSDGTLSENTETKMTPKRHNHHLIEVLSDKELSIYLEAFVANYKPGALGGLKLWGLVSSELEPAVLYAAHLLGNSNVARPSDYSDEEAELNLSEVKSACASVVVAAKHLRDTYLTAGKRRALTFYGASNDLHRKILGVSESTRKRVEKCLKPPRCLQKETWGLFRSSTSSGSNGSKSSSADTGVTGGTGATSTKSTSASSKVGADFTNAALSAVSSKGDFPRDRLRAEILEVLAAFKQTQLEIEAEMNTKVWPYFEESELFDNMLSISKGEEWQIHRRSKLQKLAAAAADAILDSAMMEPRNTEVDSKSAANEDVSEATTAALRPFATINSEPSVSDVPEVLCALRTRRAARLGLKSSGKKQNRRGTKLVERVVASGQVSHFLRIVVQTQSNHGATVLESEEDFSATPGHLTLPVKSLGDLSSDSTASMKVIGPVTEESAAAASAASASAAAAVAAEVGEEVGENFREPEIIEEQKSEGSESPPQSPAGVATKETGNAPQESSDDSSRAATAVAATKQSPPRRRRSMFSWSSSSSPMASPGSGKKSAGLWQKFAVVRRRDSDQPTKPSNSPVDTKSQAFPVPVLSSGALAPRIVGGMAWTSSADVAVKAKGSMMLCDEDVDRILAYCRPTDHVNVLSSGADPEKAGAIERDASGENEVEMSTTMKRKIVRFVLPSNDPETYLYVACLVDTKLELTGSVNMRIPTFYCAVAKACAPGPEFPISVADAASVRDAKAWRLSRPVPETGDTWETLTTCVCRAAMAGSGVPAWLNARFTGAQSAVLAQHDAEKSSSIIADFPEMGANCPWLDALNSELHKPRSRIDSDNLCVASLFSRLHLRSVIHICERMINGNAGVVLLSDKPDTLIDTAQGILCCLSPLEWTAAYVPNVPRHLFAETMALYGEEHPFLVGYVPEAAQEDPEAAATVAAARPTSRRDSGGHYDAEDASTERAKATRSEESVTGDMKSVAVTAPALDASAASAASAADQSRGAQDEDDALTEKCGIAGVDRNSDEATRKNGKDVEKVDDFSDDAEEEQTDGAADAKTKEEKTSSGTTVEEKDGDEEAAQKSFNVVTDDAPHTRYDRYALLSCVPPGTLIVDVDLDRIFVVGVDSEIKESVLYSPASSGSGLDGQLPLEEQNRSIPRLRALEVSLRRALQPRAFALDNVHGYQAVVRHMEHAGSREDHALSGLRLRSIMENWLHGLLKIPLHGYAYVQYHIPEDTDGGREVGSDLHGIKTSSKLSTAVLGATPQTVILFSRSFLSGCRHEFAPFFSALFQSRMYLEWLSRQVDI